GYGPDAFGTLGSGGSEANLIALKLARDRAVAQPSGRPTRKICERGVRALDGDLTVYASEQCHFSVEKSVDILGMGRKSLRKIDTDERFHIRTDLLLEAIEKDQSENSIPCCIVGIAGATSTGVIDPLPELAAIARANRCWFHV